MSNSKYLLFLSLFAFLGLSTSSAAERADSLAPELARTYKTWRSAFIQGNYRNWDATTAAYRKRRVRNQVVSEKKPFPASIFQNPIKPPSLSNLKLIGVLKNGNSAAMTYFGPVDLGVGGVPKNNPITLLFVRERSGWKYDTARFFNLEQMKALRTKLSKNDESVLSEEGFQPLDKVPKIPLLCKSPQFIAKIFVDCPGRVVNAEINRISPHELSDTRTAEIIWGGANFGKNKISLDIADDPTATAKGPLTIQIFLMPQIAGNLPVKAYEFLAKEGEKPGKIEADFTVTAELLEAGKPKKKP